jgi:S-formylglutathione hydrolase
MAAETAAASAPSGEAAPAPAAAENVASWKMFGGVHRRYRHASPLLGCEMTFSVYFPPSAPAAAAAASASPPAPAPVLYYLSGLTCNDENAAQKSGIQRAAAERGVCVVFPDTSPRPTGEGPGAACFPPEAHSSGWDFGFGAGFYVDATKEGWERWQMESYVMKELPAVLARLPDGASASLDLGRASITGHSMGGHGALTLALRHPAAFRSVSAFAPVCAPTRVPWGEKAFRGYFGGDEAEWRAEGARHDACELVRAFDWKGSGGGPLPPAPLIDTGGADSFLEKQLRPDELRRAIDETPGCAWAAGAAVMRLHEGYDHSYFFVATFAEDHVEHHAKALLA